MKSLEGAFNQEKALFGSRVVGALSENRWIVCSFSPGCQGGTKLIIGSGPESGDLEHGLTRPPASDRSFAILVWPCLKKYLDTFYLAFDMLILFIVSIHNSEFYGCFYPPLRYSQGGFVPRVGQVGAGPPLKEQLHELRVAALRRAVQRRVVAGRVALVHVLAEVQSDQQLSTKLPVIVVCHFSKYSLNFVDSSCLITTSSTLLPRTASRRERDMLRCCQSYYL